MSRDHTQLNDHSRPPRTVQSCRPKCARVKRPAAALVALLPVLLTVWGGARAVGATTDAASATREQPACRTGPRLAGRDPGCEQGSANGAPDCKMAADKLCQSKGFKEGKSLTTDSVEACSAKVLIPGRIRKPDDCHTNNFGTRALCQ